MATQYSQQPDFDFYRHSQWAAENKSTCPEADEMILLDEKVLERTTPAPLSIDRDLRKPTSDQSSEAFSPRSNMWHDQSQHVVYHHPRQQTHPSMPMIDTGRGPYAGMETTQEGAYGHHPSWPGSAMSGTSTPTPMFEHPGQDFHQMAYQGGHVNFNQASYPTDPFSATPMSPQSSQGGWMSANSSDGTEPRSIPVGSPSYRAASPAGHIGRDGIRKKNARFEIPAERSLANIDSLILQTADEQEKKELKQQKRLLRNRQAALDSRQRKKLHTEKLEQEKKEFNQHLSDLQDEVRQLQEALQHETEVRLHQQQEYEHYIQNVSFERDEAIRSKTLETADLRKMNNILKDHIRDYERRADSVHHLQNGLSNEFSSFDELDIEDNSWDGDFSLINNTEFDNDAMEQGDITPEPPQSANKSTIESKPDTPFSWNAFYMCLLFGAFIASNSSTNTKPAVPALSEEYRAESANVLRAVLASGPDRSPSLLPSAAAPLQTGPPNARSGASTTISGPEMARMTTIPQNKLEALHSSLTTPSRLQRETAAFSLSAANYDHLTNPDPFLSGPDTADEQLEPTPSRLQTAFNAMQESRHDVDKVINRGVNERSVLWDRVPEKVLRDFRRMVEDAEMVQ